MRAFLVTGGAGFIGSHLAEALVRRGDRVRVLDNLSTGYLANLAPVRHEIEFIHGDLLDSGTVAKAVEGVDCVFHEAALASVPRSVADPLASHAHCATATVALLDSARKAGVRRVVYAGSSSVYGDQPSRAKRETDLPRPISPYGAAKLAGESYGRAFFASYGLQTVTLRYFNVFGPRQDPNSPYAAVIPLFITAILSGKRPVIYGDGRQSRDFTFVANVVHGNLLAADAPEAAGQVINVACGQATSLLELLEAINQVLGTHVEPIHAPPRPGDIRESMADIALARRLLSYEPLVGLSDGLRQSIDYYRQLAGR